jgi:Transglutaminase-like superfamily
MDRTREPTHTLLDYYSEPGPMTTGGPHADALQALPDDMPALVEAVQGLLIYDDVATEYYGAALPDQRRRETHLRRTEAMLEQLLALDPRPLTMPRALDKRLVGVCHHYMLLMVAALRAKGIPARGRGGFGAYFNAPYYEDHWVCEYWNADLSRWVLVDAQLDEVWRRKHRVGFDILDVPRSQFVVAGDAWQACRRGAADAGKYGIHRGDLRGLWFIGGSLVRDLAALNKQEPLPFDVWGAQPPQPESLDSEQLALFEGLASLTREPDAAFAAVRRIYEEDDELRVPATVYNALLRQQQPFV